VKKPNRGAGTRGTGDKGVCITSEKEIKGGPTTREEGEGYLNQKKKEKV